MFSFIFRSLAALTPATCALSMSNSHPCTSNCYFSCLVNGQSSVICYLTMLIQIRENSLLCWEYEKAHSHMIANSTFSNSQIHSVIFSSVHFASAIIIKCHLCLQLFHTNVTFEVKSHSRGWRGVLWYAHCALERLKVYPMVTALFLSCCLCSAGCNCKGLNSSESPESPWGRLLLVRAMGLPGIC